MWSDVVPLLLNYSHLIQGDIEACNCSVASSSTFIASCWKKHEPFHTAYTSVLTLGIKSGHTLWFTAREYVFNQSGFMKAQNTQTCRPGCSVTFVDKMIEERGKKCTVMNKSLFTEAVKCLLHRPSGVNSHKFTLKSRKSLLRERCHPVT